MSGGKDAGLSLPLPSPGRRAVPTPMLLGLSRWDVGLEMPRWQPAHRGRERGYLDEHPWPAVMAAVVPVAAMEVVEIRFVVHDVVLLDDINPPRRDPDVLWLVDNYGWWWWDRRRTRGRRRRWGCLDSGWSSLFLGLDGITDHSPTNTANGSSDQRPLRGVPGSATDDGPGPSTDGYPRHRPLLACRQGGRTGS